MVQRTGEDYDEYSKKSGLNFLGVSLWKCWCWPAPQIYHGEFTKEI